MCPVSLTVWFVCKSCKLNFAKVDDYIEHKKENHFTEFQVQNKSRIVFEERIEGDSDFDDATGWVETKPIVLKEEVEVTAQAINYCCDSESNRDVLVPKTEFVTYESQIEETEILQISSVQPQPNPFVLVKRLYSMEIHGASRATKPKWDLKKHLKSSFVRRPFKCLIPNCGKAYVYQNSLSKHKRSHSNARPFGCPKCNKTYKFRNYLVEHLRMHTGERSFKCPVNDCNKAFAKRVTFRQHERLVHCNKLFTA